MHDGVEHLLPAAYAEGMDSRRQARAGDNGALAQVRAWQEDSQEKMKKRTRVRISPLQQDILDKVAQGPVSFAQLLGDAPTPARRATLSRAVSRLVARDLVQKNRSWVAVEGCLMMPRVTKLTREERINAEFAAMTPEQQEEF